MSTSEVFNQRRMNRCADIQHSILSAWQQTNSLQYVVRAMEPLEGMSFAELRQQYFMVGVGNQLSEIPFHDMLVVFSMVERYAAARKLPGSSAAKVSPRFQATVGFTDVEAARLLSLFQIQTPFDQGKYLQVVAQHETWDSDFSAN